MKSMGKLEAVPAIFNINEPFLFGMPMLMNPWLALPFFFVPVVVAALTYGAVYFGILPPLNGVAAPWTTPIILYRRMEVGSMARRCIDYFNFNVLAIC